MELIRTTSVIIQKKSESLDSLLPGLFPGLKDVNVVVYVESHFLINCLQW